MPPAARVTDMHTCPMVTGIVPHVGGPILPPGVPTVLINFLPAAHVSSMATCVGPPDVIVKGSTGVMIGYLPAARMGDLTAHGGVIVLGSPNVIIGEIGSPSPGAAGLGGVVAGMVAGVGLQSVVTKSASSAAGTAGAGGGTSKRTPITQAQANAEFKKLAAQANRIPFDYPADCCYSRAQEMDRMMKADGIDCGKVWNYENPNGPPLVANTPNSPTGQVTWRYHVAPVVDVKGDDGVTRTEVMDPSMFDHPVTVDEWKAAQHAPNSTTEFDDHFDPNTSPYYRDPGGKNPDYDKDYKQTNQQFQIHKADRDSQDPNFVSDLAKRRAARVAANSN